MAKFRITSTLNIEVEADTEDEAMEKAQGELTDYFRYGNFDTLLKIEKI